MSDRYATNAFYGFSDYEKGVFSNNDLGVRALGDNPDFIYPPKTLHNAANGSSQKVQRGYMRMISTGSDGAENLAKRRLHFQFNPDSIVRSVTARNDIQFWMNQDPSQLMQPIPGDANFAFDLLFNREAEVVSGSYSDNGNIRKSTAPVSLPLKGAGDSTAQSVEIPHNAVTDIGVLADLMVFDEIIGQTLNTQLIETVLNNASKTAGVSKPTRGSDTNEPITKASLTALLDLSDPTTIGSPLIGVKVNGGGSGYTSIPEVQISGGGGTGAKISVEIENGAVKKATVINGGSGYTSPPVIKLIGGGSGNQTSASGTSDAQDTETQQDFDYEFAKQNLYNNFGNSAFLVSTPIRIVFSSLFMVEGYITSTMVTFNKFNAQMVPTQCSVGITMQALYIGFARKDTFMTLKLNDLQNSSNASSSGIGITNPANTKKRNQELVALDTLATKLFVSNKISNNNTNEDNPSPNTLYGNNGDGKNTDYTQTLSVRVIPTTELINEIKKGRIEKIEVIGNWQIRYQGNTNGPADIGNGQGVTIGQPLANITASRELNIKDFKEGKTTPCWVKFIADSKDQITSDDGVKLDTTTTSKYNINVTFTFKMYVNNVEKDVIDARQYFAFQKRNVSYNFANSLSKEGSLPVRRYSN